jgi:glycine cleavage system regulatory protein
MAPAVELFVVCKVWDSVLQASDLRASVQKNSGMTSLPSVIIRGKEKSAFAVLARGKHASEDKVICSGSTADEVQQEFEKHYAGTPTSAPKRLSRIEFEVTKDRPGLLAEASALFKSHQVNIRSALISTSAGGKTAKHVYEFSDPAGSEVSAQTFSGLKKGFEKLQYGENPNTVEPIKGQPAESVDELRAKVLELKKQLEACQTENTRLSSALEEALGKK